VYSTPSGSFGVTARVVIYPNAVPSKGKNYSIISRYKKVSDAFLCTLFETCRLPKQIFTVARLANLSRQASSRIKTHIVLKRTKHFVGPS